MSIIQVKLANASYDINIGSGSLPQLGTKLSEWYNGSAVAIVTDNNVNRLYGDILQQSLECTGYHVHRIVISAGEENKSLSTLDYIYTQLAAANVDKSGLVAAFGGGVVGDITGFAAATYMRGIPYIQIPTTLMSQLDSSIGGKTAINLSAGKNLAGSIYQPKAVFIDPNLLETLDERTFCDGLGEAVKYSAIMDRTLFDVIVNKGSLEGVHNSIEQIIYKCCSMKRDIIQIDEFDMKDRLILNFGHTIGHGIERYYDYKGYTHGEAVALGMQIITKNSEQMGFTEAGTFQALKEAIRICKLPTKCPSFDTDRLLEIICRDKKSQDSQMRLVLLKSIGQGYIQAFPKDQLHRFILQ